MKIFNENFTSDDRFAEESESSYKCSSQSH